MSVPEKWIQENCQLNSHKIMLTKISEFIFPWPCRFSDPGKTCRNLYSFSCLWSRIYHDLETCNPDIDVTATSNSEWSSFADRSSLSLLESRCPGVAFSLKLFSIPPIVIGVVDELSWWLLDHVRFISCTSFCNWLYFWCNSALVWAFSGWLTNICRLSSHIRLPVYSSLFGSRFLNSSICACWLLMIACNFVFGMNTCAVASSSAHISWCSAFRIASNRASCSWRVVVVTISVTSALDELVRCLELCRVVTSESAVLTRSLSLCKDDILSLSCAVCSPPSSCKSIRSCCSQNIADLCAISYQSINNTSTTQAYNYELTPAMNEPRIMTSIKSRDTVTIDNLSTLTILWDSCPPMYFCTYT